METSSDILGAGLINKLKQQASNISFVGVAGPLMQAAGCEVWYKMEELAVMGIGIVEIFARLPKLFKIRSNLIDRFINLQPDIFVGIDAPDFNIYLEAKLKQRGIKTIHYVSPSIWAWRKNRLDKIGRAANLVLTILPFEKKIYDDYHIPCRFVGHTLADIIPLHPDKKAARIQLNITYDAKCLAILPGSRWYEVKMLSSYFLHAAKILLKDFPKLKILIPMVNKQRHQQFNDIYREIALLLPIKYIGGEQSRIALIASDVSLIASGTATLECMLAKCPMVVGYRMNQITYWIAKYLVKTPFISLPNLLAGQELVKEFIQHECTPEQLALSLKSLLIDKNKVKYLIQSFLKLHKKIRCNANEQAAKAILELSK